MRQVLFNIPYTEIPIYGYGFMLFMAFLACIWLGSKVGERYGVTKEMLQDLAIWLFITGIGGARITFVIAQWLEGKQTFRTFWDYFAIWDGGLVFYGAVPGGLLGFLLVYHLMLRKRGIAVWQLVDVVAPCIALGLVLGRGGCLLNGCCYGNVACAHCPAISFPLPSPPRYEMVERGYQTVAGFALHELDPRCKVSKVEPGSRAEQAGLREGDVLIKVNGKAVTSVEELALVMTRDWPRGQTELQLVVQRDAMQDGQPRLAEIDLPPFTPYTIGLHPTQIYESISMLLLLLVLLSFLPFKRYDGDVMALLMLCYAVHRFLNEMLRTDTRPVAFGLTLSQNISIAILVSGLAIGLYRRQRGIPATDAQPLAPPPPPVPTPAVIAIRE